MSAHEAPPWEAPPPPSDDDFEWAKHPENEPDEDATSAYTQTNGHKHANGAGFATNRPPFDLLWYDDIQPTPDVQDFVQGTLIEGGSAVVYGESNSGKTFFATDLALHVGAGLQWNGRRVEQRGVIYCVLEGGQGFRNRVAAWKSAHDSLDTPVHFAAITSAINLLHPDADTIPLIETIHAAAAKIGIPVGLIVIDTLSRALAGGNENAPEDMGALVRNMDRIRQETKAMVLFIHHSGKDQARGARGHSLLRAAIDTEIEVETKPEGSTRYATVVKQRDLRKGDVHAFILQVVDIGQNRHGEPITTCLVEFPDNPEPKPDKKPERAKRQNSHEVTAFKILNDLIFSKGELGAVGTDAGVRSIAADDWRSAFFETLEGDEPAAKRQAYKRVRDSLVATQKIGLRSGRIWLML